MSNLRISCLVLRQVEHLRGTATMQNLPGLLPELKYSQISRALANLCDQGRIEKNGQIDATNRGACGSTRAIKLYRYKTNPDWEPGQPSKNIEQRPPPSRRKSASKQRSPAPVLPQAPRDDRLRQQKIDCLYRMLDEVHGRDYQLIVAILGDYGESVPLDPARVSL